MKLVWWMAAGSVLSWLVIRAIGPQASGDTLLGMVGPLAAAIGTWALLVRTSRRTPERLTSVMVAAFGAKMLLFGVYVTVMLKGLLVRPLPFVASFVGYFIALHLTEALCLRRLLPDGTRASHE
jgi:hypothetical protein